jgi:hypothetical protein
VGARDRNVEFNSLEIMFDVMRLRLHPVIEDGEVGQELSQGDLTLEAGKKKLKSCIQ